VCPAGPVSDRWIPLQPLVSLPQRSQGAPTAAILAEHVDRFTVPGLDSLVFPNRAGNSLISSSFWQHHFKSALDAVGLSCRFHDLRHTSVALAIAEGAHPKAIQVRMGHSSINVTLDRYGHLFPELDEAIAAGFGERIATVRALRSAS
jgi:integrase